MDFDLKSKYIAATVEGALIRSDQPVVNFLETEKAHLEPEETAAIRTTVLAFKRYRGDTRETEDVLRVAYSKSITNVLRVSAEVERKKS